MNGNCVALNSVGIDIGTTTTQLVFSRLHVANTLPRHMAPKLEIVDRQIVYRSKIYFTPLLDPFTINYQEVREIIDQEFRQAGYKMTDIDTGAVIITGQSAKKNNAAALIHTLAGSSGSFVVATAGPHIECLLAGRGAGAAARSAEQGNVVANIDIGGGTANIAVFKDGMAIDSCCFTIGGRLIKVNPDGIVTYIAQELIPFNDQLGLGLCPGKKTTAGKLQQLARTLAESLLAAFLPPHNKKEQPLLATDGLRLDYTVDEIMFSGGVADYIYPGGQLDSLAEICRYGDIGPLLGATVREVFVQAPAPLITSRETIRATVIGAGVQSLRLSGSTILVNRNLLPLKNIPVIKVSDLADFSTIIRVIAIFIEESGRSAVALAIPPITPSSFAAINRAAGQIAAIYKTLYSEKLTVVIITENDCALALGQAIGMITGSKNIMCLDQVAVDEGDYIDIGLPIDDKAVPVVIKTLLFT